MIWWMHDMMNAWYDEYMKGWMHERMNVLKDECMKVWMHERMNAWKDECMKGWINQRMNKWKDKQRKKGLIHENLKILFEHHNLFKTLKVIRLYSWDVKSWQNHPHN